MKNFILLSLSLSLVASSASCQTKDTIQVCSLFTQPPSAMAYSIPVNKCISQENIVSQEWNKITSVYLFEAKPLHFMAFSVGNINFLEVLYKSPACDTSAMFFVTNSKKVLAYSKAYSIVDSDYDFRKESDEEQIILYRKGKIKGRASTFSFVYDLKTKKLNCYVDDGFSIWE